LVDVKASSNSMKSMEASSRGGGKGKRPTAPKKAQPEAAGKKKDDKKASKAAEAAPPVEAKAGKPQGRAVDPRFTKRHTDHRFGRIAVPQRENHSGGRGRLDSRTDARFAPSKVDSRGRAVGPTDAELEAMAAEDEEEEEEEEEEGEEGSDVEYEYEEDADDEEGYELGEGEEELLDEDAAAWSGESDIDESDATKRMAIVKCDWDHVRAVDLFAVLFHSMPLGGRLKSVKVYLSDFGAAQLESEKRFGPDLWEKGEEGAAAPAPAPAPAQPAAPPQQEPAGDDEEAEESDGDDPAMFTEVGEDGEMFSSGKFRKYELARMKYYYAIATFDSPGTAAAVYAQCDGMDIEASGVVLDLRYVPDEETFEDGRIKDSAAKIPPNFKPMKSFKNAATSQSKFKVSWDQDDVLRTSSLRDAFDGEHEDVDMMAYLASDSSDEDNVGEDDGTVDVKKARRDAKRRDIRSKYSALLEDVGGLNDELPPEHDEEDEEAGESDGEDDDLNRMSDVEFDSNEEGEDDEEGGEDEEDTFGMGEAVDLGSEHDDDETAGNKEASFDFGADNKAQTLHNAMVRKKKMDGATIGEQLQLKYKQRRKDARAAKRDMIAGKLGDSDSEDGDDEERQERRTKLRGQLGDAVAAEAGDDGLTKKERRKQLASQSKARAKGERDAFKKRRTMADLGAKPSAVQEEQAPSAPEVVAAQSDNRFMDRLVSDPRFHLDVKGDQHKKNKALADLATGVTKARRSGAGKKKAEAPAPAEDAAVDFFMGRAGKPQKPGKPQKRSRE
jgi:hypothetical protein